MNETMFQKILLLIIGRFRLYIAVSVALMAHLHFAPILKSAIVHGPAWQMREHELLIYFAAVMTYLITHMFLIYTIPHISRYNHEKPWLVDFKQRAGSLIEIIYKLIFFLALCLSIPSLLIYIAVLQEIDFSIDSLIIRLSFLVYVFVTWKIVYGERDTKWNVDEQKMESSIVWSIIRVRDSRKVSKAFKNSMLLRSMKNKLEKDKKEKKEKEILLLLDNQTYQGKVIKE